MYHVFLSHPHTHAVWVEELARELQDKAGLEVWLDQWTLVPGEPWQPELARGLEEAATCAVFIGAETPQGWVQQEIQKALNRQANDASFRVIPVLMPGADEAKVKDFLELRTWVDFRNDRAKAFHTLVCGIRGVAPGRWPPPEEAGDDPIRRQLQIVASYAKDQLIRPEVEIALQTKLMERALANA